MTKIYQFSNSIGRSRLYCAGLAFLLCLCWTGHTLAQSVVRGPYLQMGTQTTITVRWRTNVATDSKVFYGSNPASLIQSISSAGLTTNHELTINELTPNTQYFYAIGNQSGIMQGGTAAYHFITSPPDGTRQKVRAWILGDSGTANGNAADVRDGFTTYNSGEHVDIMMMLGDNAYNSGTDAEYQAAVFDMYPEWLRKVALWACPGNHEYYSTINNYLNIWFLDNSRDL